ncbi:succinyl-CoA synthetase subsunit alpha [Prevotella intermedia ZT]|uniref:Succinyl-CoA synthetase subsunit alpha n=1 Tax=Prevotella intermedia ZT TaxID=1347790 RepID=A0AAP0V8Y6_PREIN|nr:succinyl-CoA synthetase subsunit alpha [Prevotella intermedia ZT]
MRLFGQAQKENSTPLLLFRFLLLCYKYKKISYLCTLLYTGWALKNGSHPQKREV